MTNIGSQTMTVATADTGIFSKTDTDHAGDYIGDSEWSANTLESGVAFTEEN